MVRDLKAPADFASVLICKLGQKLVLAMEGRINKQMPASFNVVSYSSENVEMVYRHQSPPVPSSRKPSHAISGKLKAKGDILYPRANASFYRAIKRLEARGLIRRGKRYRRGELCLTDLGLEAARAVLLKDVEEPKH